MYFKVKPNDISGHRIGSRMFPVADRKGLRVFTQENTKEIVSAKLAAVIDSLASQFSDGFCYTNAGLIQQEAIKQGIDVKLYAGWVSLDL